MSYMGLFGGSFNPVHVGHLRLAIEILEYKALPLAVDHVQLIPCANPAHKCAHDFLPFALRHAMLEAACAPIDGLSVSTIEAERQGPSYTWHTLESYAQKYPRQRLLFMEGIENLLDLPHWYKGLEIPILADMGVTPRGDGDKDLFIRTVRAHWPRARISSGPCPVASIDFAHREAHIFYMPIPRLDISSSYIRQRWLSKGSLHALMPDAALLLLEQAQHEVQHIWK